MALEEIPNFRTNIGNDPLELLQHIETLMNVLQRVKHPALTLIKVLARYTKIRQGENESLIDYLSRFKSETEVVTRMFRKNLISGIAKQTKAYRDIPDTNVNDQEEVIEKDWDRFKAILFLRNAESTQFGDLLIDYRKEFANNIDKYPADLQTMVDVMRQQPKRKQKPLAKLQPKKDKDKEK